MIPSTFSVGSCKNRDNGSGVTALNSLDPVQHHMYPELYMYTSSKQLNPYLPDVINQQLCVIPHQFLQILLPPLPRAPYKPSAKLTASFFVPSYTTSCERTIKACPSLDVTHCTTLPPLFCSVGAKGTRLQVDLDHVVVWPDCVQHRRKGSGKWP